MIGVHRIMIYNLGRFKFKEYHRSDKIYRFCSKLYKLQKKNNRDRYCDRLTLWSFIHEFITPLPPWRRYISSFQYPISKLNSRSIFLIRLEVLRQSQHINVHLFRNFSKISMFLLFLSFLWPHNNYTIKNGTSRKGNYRYK